MGSRSRCRRRGELGAVAVEFALLVPILLTLVGGIVDVGFAVNRYTILNNAAREGIRTASLGATSSEVSTAVSTYLGDSGAAASSVTLTCLTPTGSACTSWTAGAASGGTAILTVTYSHPWITPVGEMMGGPLVELSKTTRMRIE